MKKFLTMLGSVLMAGMLVVPAFADSNGVFVDSVGLATAPDHVDISSGSTVTIGGQEVDVKDAIDKGEINVVITPATKADAAPTGAQEALKDASKELSSADSTTKLQFVDKANEDKFNQIVADKANGDANNLVASEVFDISMTDQSGDIVKAGKITMTIPVEDANSIALVLHKPNGEWEVVDFTVSPDGKSITITLDSLSPIALLKVKQGGTNTDNKDNNGANNGTKPSNPSNPSTTKPGVTSPQTGVNVNYFFAIAAVVAVCAAAVCVKRAKRA